jgi:hypothetical protein
MSDSFNGYHVWLGIPPNEQPPNHYRLLGISLFETDLDVIDHAADRQMAHVRTFQAGRHGPLSQQILNELAAARVCLLNAQRKSEYDQQLRSRLAASAPRVAPLVAGKAVPVAQPVADKLPKAAPAVPKAAPAVPVAAPVASSAAPVAAPVKPIAATPVSAAPVAAAPLAEPVELDSYEVDTLDAPLATRVDDEPDPLDAYDGPASFSAEFKVRNVRRPINRDASLQRAVVYIFMGVAVLVVVMVLYSMVRRFVGTPDWRQWFTMPQETAPLEPEPAGPMPPPAPQPLAPGAAPASSAPVPATPNAAGDQAPAPDAAPASS